MKNQRWPGDDQTIGEEFASSLKEERNGMAAWNKSFGNDFIADDARRLDAYQRQELEQSACSMLDVVGMQPHAREFIEHQMNYCRSNYKFEMCEGERVDHPPGIQYSGMP
jgi:hypothetical protein